MTSELTEGELKMLRFALDEAQELLWSRDGFSDDDQKDLANVRLMLLGAGNGDR